MLQVGSKNRCTVQWYIIVHSSCLKFLTIEKLYTKLISDLESNTTVSVPIDKNRVKCLDLEKWIFIEGVK